MVSTIATNGTLALLMRPHEQSEQGRGAEAEDTTGTQHGSIQGVSDDAHDRSWKARTMNRSPKTIP